MAKAKKQNPFLKNIRSEAETHTDFRRVLYTSKQMQIVTMSLPPGEDVGEETHKYNDQFFRIETGSALVTIDDASIEATDGDAIIVPSGCKHNIKNTSTQDRLVLYSIYSPPHHKNGIVQATKEESQTSREKFDGETSL